MIARRLLGAFGAVLATAAVSLVCVVVTAAPAQAYQQGSISRTGWAYTDSRLPHQSFVNPAGDVPIGARVGPTGEKHRSRSYFSFDLARLKDSVVHSATLLIRERSVADCTEAQPVELWRTDPITATTSWASPPRKRELLGTALGGEGSTCPYWLSWDITPALKRLVDHDKSTVTVMVKVPHGLEGDITHGRTLATTPAIQVDYNHAPTVTRVGLEFPSWACGTKQAPEPIGARTNVLTAQFADADQFDFVRGEFAVWPVDDPAQRVERPGGSYSGNLSKVEWDMRNVPHGTVLAISARGYDSYDYSKWSKPCYVEVDAEPPAAPVVTSERYPNDGEPHGGTGVPGTFVFSANGSADVVGYYWGRFGEAYNYVPAPSPGADVTVEYTPTSFFEWLTVRSVDAAGQRSPDTSYEFHVRSTAPGAQLTMGGVGLPSSLRMSSGEAGVTEFGYRVGDGAETRVPAGADATAEASITFTELGLVRIVVRAYAGGELIGGQTLDVRVEDTPLISSGDFVWPDKDGVVGMPGTFTFQPRRTGVVAYEYFFGDEGLQHLDAAADGSGTLEWTPTEAGFTMLRVRSVSADGTTSEIGYYEFSVIDTKPTVWSSDYPDGGAWGGVGIPGEFGFDTQMPDVDVFVYRFNGGPEQTVAHEYNSARVTLTPARSGTNTLVVRSRFLDGTLSPERIYTFEVSDAPVVVSDDYPEHHFSGQPGQPGQFTFNPGRDGITEYHYTLESGEQLTVPAGPDGRATVEITPTHPGHTALRVVSATADGTLTRKRYFSFYVRDPTVHVWSGYDEHTPRGGTSTPARFEYRLDGGDPVLVAAVDGLATPTFTPTRSGHHLMTVRGRTAAGTWTDETRYGFVVM